MVNVSRLMVLAAAILLPVVASAAEEDCTVLPAEPTQNPHVWKPTASTWAGSGTPCSFSGYNPIPNGTATASEYSSYAALLAEVMSNTLAFPSGTVVIDGVFHCGDQTVSGVVRTWYRINAHTTTIATVRGQNFYALAGGDTTCDVPEEDSCESLMNRDAQGDAADKPLDWEPPETSCIDMGGGVKCDSYRRGALNNGGRTRCIPGTDLGCEPVEYSRSDNGDGTANFLWRNSFTGLTCSVEDPEPEEIIVEGEACNGPYCEGVEARPGCGYLNDKYICTDNLGDDECTVYPDGSRNCGENAPTPPVPDNGTPGTPAEPDESIDVCTGASSCQTINNYNTTTVGGSSRDPGGGTSPDNGPGSGATGNGAGSSGNNGSGTGGGDGDGEGDGGDTAGPGGACDTPPTCSGDPIQCALLREQFNTRCQEGMSDTDILARMNFTDAELGSGGDTEVEITSLDSAGSLGGGSACPAPLTVSVLGTSINLDIWQAGCQMAAWFAPFVLAMGYFFAGLLIVRGVV